MSDEGQGYGGYASPVPSSTVPDQPDKHGLPPFSSFQDQEPSASRLLDISSWDYYSTDGRIERDGFPILVPQYRPWESKDELNKLPSFQSQFTTFSQDANGETVSLTTLTPAVPSELPGFQTLGAVPQGGRGYPLVPAPVQAREIPGVQQQLLDERHIHLFQGPQQYYPPQQQATLLTVVKTEPLIVTQLDPQPYSGLKLDPLDSRKKERRKVRASSLESSAESDGVSSVESSGQVAAISTTSGFKSSPLVHPGPLSHDDCMDISDKPVKKKRKRCGECIGCQRKDNCGDCAPCRNDKSHQICKMRRCEKLTDKKVFIFY